MGRYDLYESGDVLYIRTSGTILLSDLEEEYGFVINLTNRELAYATDWCGVNQGKTIINSRR